ncbi:MAG: hypothetical protein ACOCVV_05075, partial [Marinobacter sp.]
MQPSAGLFRRLQPTIALIGLLALLWGLTPASLHAQGQNGNDWTYTLRSGESFGQVARELLNA